VVGYLYLTGQYDRLTEILNYEDENENWRKKFGKRTFKN
jgi:23S rRNA maturation mini-RNase III